MKIHIGNFKSNLAFIKQTGLFDKKKRILEIGSGTGALVNHFKKKGYRIQGTEINPARIREAKQLFNLSLRKVTSEKLPFSDKAFDLVISFDVFEHIPDTAAHLQEVSRVLKQDGSYLFATPNLLTNIPFEVIKNKHLTSWKKYHCSLQTYWKLKKNLEKQNFTFHFFKIPVVNQFFLKKIDRISGKPGRFFISIINPDKFPLPFRTNFHVVAKKTESKV